jgi:cytochrome c-type protein NapB
MKHKLMLVASLAAFTVACSATGDLAVLDDSLGLSQVSVFDVPAPAAFEYRDLDPKVAGVLPRAWEEAPPQIPHRVDRYLPVNARLNKCLECHEEPDKIGNKQSGKPTPMSASHYIGSGKDLAVANNRYVCTLCHAPQTEAATLVDNTFQKAP